MAKGAYLVFKQLTGKFTIYQYMILFLIILTLDSSFFYGFGVNALVQVLIAVLAGTLLDLLINYFKYKKFEFPQSALISGLFVGGLLTQDLPWHIYVLAGFIAIFSKHLIKYNQKNILNPAIFGILAVSVIFGAEHSWWISSPLILVLIFGIFIIWRLRRLDIALSFLAGYYIINSAVELSIGGTFNDVYYTIINGGVIYFFAMFMLIEPKTSPASGKKQRIVYGVFVAALFALISVYPKLYSNSLAVFFTMHGLPLVLAVGNIFVPFLNRLKFEPKNKEVKKISN